MRAKIIILILTVFSMSSNGQLPSLKAMFLNPNVYRTRTDLKAIRLIHKNSKKIYNDTVTIKVSNLGHLDYKIINEDDNGFVIIRVLPNVKLLKEPLRTDSSKTINVLKFIDKDLPKKDSTNAYNYYFAVKKDAFKPLSKTLLSTKIIGVPLIQPIKLRPSKGGEGYNLSGEFTVSYNFGIRLKLGSDPFRQNFLTIIPYGFGIGAAKYFKENKDGTLTEKKDSFAVTYSQCGLLLTIQKLNFGVFTGRDAMIDSQKDWFYQGSRWFSFGLGYKFKTD